MAEKIWVLLTEDPNVNGTGENEVPGALTIDSTVITVHPDRDAVLAHIRATYDPKGRYTELGSGSLQNSLEGSGYEFEYHEVAVAALADTVWLLVVGDPHNVVVARLDEVPGALTLPSCDVVTAHADYDALVQHLRRTYDPDGEYADEGSGALHNYLRQDSYRITRAELPLQSGK